MTQKKKEQRCSVKKRLEFIDFRLFWGEQINRVEIQDSDGESLPPREQHIVVSNKSATLKALKRAQQSEGVR